MALIIETIAPVFVLIAIGFAAAKARLMAQTGVAGLNRFVLLFAIPALLFRTMTRLDIALGPPWGLWLAFFGAGAVVWVSGVVASRRLTSLKPAGGASAGIGSAFGNLVLMGIPLAVAQFGERALAPAALIIAIHAPIQWFAATLRAEWGGASGASGLGRMGRELVVSLVRNPIVMALALGLAWNASALMLPASADKVLALLGQAAVPAALFALGASLAGYRLRGEFAAVFVLLALKMVLFPLLAGIAAYKILALDDTAAAVVTLFAALPPGVNAYLFAVRYQAGEAAVSAAIAVGTALSFVTVSIVLAIIG